MSPDELRDWMRDFQPTSFVSAKILGVSVGLLEKAAGGKDNRKKIYQFLFGVDSTSLLTDGQKAALVAWVSPAKEGGAWTMKSIFADIENILSKDKP